MTPPRLIALCSPSQGSGKSEVAGRLVSHHGYKLVKFAGGVKVMLFSLLAPLYGSDKASQMVNGHLKEVQLGLLGNVTPRTLMQTLGTEWGRETIGPDFWVNIAMAQVDKLLAEGHKVVMDDMRFPNEMDAVLDRGGKPVRVIRPDAIPHKHPSEGELDSIRMASIENDCTLEELHKGIDLYINAHQFMEPACG